MCEIVQIQKAVWPNHDREIRSHGIEAQYFVDSSLRCGGDRAYDTKTEGFTGGEQHE